MLVWSSCGNYVSEDSYKTLDIYDISIDQLMSELTKLKDSYPSSTALFCKLDLREAYDGVNVVHIDEWRHPTLKEKKERDQIRKEKDANWKKYQQKQYEKLKKELGYD